ncbi:MAG: hypothetical protein WC408_05905 [Candidatus Micrarchaeia archaeon]|jgi:hypothetical protein
MYADDSVPLRIPKTALADLRRLKARKMQIEGRNVADAEIISELVAFGRKNEELLFKPAGKKKHFLDIAGFLPKGGPKSYSAKEIEEVVYGEL